MKDEIFSLFLCCWLVVLFACNCAGITGAVYSYGDTTLTVFEPNIYDGGSYEAKVISTQDGGAL